MAMLGWPRALRILGLVLVLGMARLAPRLEFLGERVNWPRRGQEGAQAPCHPEMEDGSHGTSPKKSLFPPLAAEIF